MEFFAFLVGDIGYGETAVICDKEGLGWYDNT